MSKYNIEFTWQIESKLKNLIVVTNFNENRDLVQLCDSLYNFYIQSFEEVRIFFFGNKENASHFIYMRLIKNVQEKRALENCHCLGHLVRDSLTGKIGTEEFLKYYENPLLKPHSVVDNSNNEWSVTG